jgi:hypothetical protein
VTKSYLKAIPKNVGENCMRSLRQDMRQLVALFVALTPGIVVFGLPTQSQAQTTISGVTVQVGPSRTIQIWSDATLSAGQTLVLAQNPPTGISTPPFNFDTSDVDGCPTATVSGTATSSGSSTTFGPFTDTNKVLTPLGCPTDTSHNEAQNYSAPIGTFISDGLQITVQLGYADNDHSDACGSDILPPAGSTTCFPSPFQTATIFQGSAQTQAGACLQGTNPCYDSGVILFKAEAISTNACPLTQGFWKNHFPGSWPSLVIANGLMIGSMTYTADQLEANLERKPAGGNALVILSHQLIAAKLNILNGSDPTPIAATITAADTAIGNLNINTDSVHSSTDLGTLMTDLSNTLDSYNSSSLTPTCTGPK